MSRPGIRTSEFWVTIVAMILAALNEVFGLGIDGEEIAIIFGPPAAYVVSRGLSKIGAPAASVPLAAPTLEQTGGAP